MTTEAYLPLAYRPLIPSEIPNQTLSATLPKELRHTCVVPAFEMIGYSTTAPMHHLFQCVCGIGEIRPCARLMGGHEGCSICGTEGGQDETGR